jgi:hypothetical protein
MSAFWQLGEQALGSKAGATAAAADGEGPLESEAPQVLRARPWLQCARYSPNAASRQPLVAASSREQPRVPRHLMKRIPLSPTLPGLLLILNSYIMYRSCLSAILSECGDRLWPDRLTMCCPSTDGRGVGGVWVCVRGHMQWGGCMAAIGPPFSLSPPGATRRERLTKNDGCGGCTRRFPLERVCLPPASTQLSWHTHTWLCSTPESPPESPRHRAGPRAPGGRGSPC